MYIADRRIRMTGRFYVDTTHQKILLERDELIYNNYYDSLSLSLSSLSSSISTDFRRIPCANKDESSNETPYIHEWIATKGMMCIIA